MRAIKFVPFARLAQVALVLLMFTGHASIASAADLKLQATLIWGTNDETSPVSDHKKLDGKLTKKFRKVFKWKNYFEVKQKTESVPSGETRKIEMSDRCAVEIKNLGDSRVEAKLLGAGKLVYKGTETLTAGKELVMAGENENDTAWFVVIRAAE